MSLRERVFAVSKAMERRIVPELRYSQAQFEDHLRAHAAGASAWLDVGCGHQLLPDWRAEAEREIVQACPLVVGIDFEFDAIRRHRTFKHVCRGDVTHLPFPAASFDLVTANMVVEHLSDPATQFREIARVLRPGGVFLFHTPNAESYLAPLGRFLSDPVRQVLARVLEARKSEDVFPTFYRANTEAQIRDVAARAGLEVAAVNYTGSLPTLRVIPPLAFFELLLLRQLMRRPGLAKYRQTLICALRRPAASAEAPASLVGASGNAA